MMKRVAMVVAALLALSGLSAQATRETLLPIPVKVLILPKFEIGKMTGDFPGEAQYYYDAYCKGGDAYEIEGGVPDHKLYVKDGVALYVTGMGKVNAAMSVDRVLGDRRFDFSDAYVLATGCAGANYEYGVMGDVFLVTSVIDGDLGHTADARDLPEGYETTWFHDSGYDSSSYKVLDQELCDKLYRLVKDVKVETTPKTRAFMAAAFGNAPWATRDPKVLRGATVSADNYWKGAWSHKNALKMAQVYGTPDPYATTEMEDIAIAVVLDRMGKLDRLIDLRDAVNTDVFMNGASAASLWDENFDDQLSSGDSVEVADIFKTAMENNYKVGKVIVDAILSGKL